jgi:hypothetical protein
MKFTIEEGHDNTIHFLDITITKTSDSLTFDVYRKPTMTDTIIPKHSCHPPEHKSATIKFMTNQRDTYCLSDENKVKENNIIKQILHNNKYDTTDLHRHPKVHKDHKPPTHTTNWAKFTYIGKETKYITKLFKKTTVRMAYTTHNTINKLLHIGNYNFQDKYQMSRIYKLTCPDYNKAYIRQTRRPFAVRFREHFRDYTHGYNMSKFAQHLLDHHHSIGPMNTIMDITTKGRMMNTMERFHIYKETLKNNQINDKCTVKPNIIFDVLAQHNPDRGHSTQP